MPATNSPARYGQVARLFHWLTALTILSAIALGLWAASLPYGTSEALAAKARLFSLHKTIGIAAFALAAARILWALSQPRPAPLHPERRLETLAAEAVHWMLYIAMLLMPLSGWVHHAAQDGFAPILWPFGQSLPFVPKSQTLAAFSGQLHGLSAWLLIAAIALHVAGALKHALIDRDATLARMWRGAEAGRPARHPRTPAFAALAIFALVAALAWEQSAPEARAANENTPQAAATSGWQVQEGSLGFTVRQMGAEVTGTLPAWTAEIAFTEAAQDGRHGHVRVSIDTTALSLGAVTEQAKAADFFDTAAHPTAIFEADLLPAATGYEAQGTLTLRGAVVPVTLPFTLVLDGDTATMTGTATLDRRDFGMGQSYTDEASVGFAVTVSVGLTATRG